MVSMQNHLNSEQSTSIPSKSAWKSQPMPTGQPIFAKVLIDLDQPNNYKAGDIVSGCVKIVSDDRNGQELDVGSISIAFVGRSTTTRPLTKVPGHRKTVQFFEYRKTVFNGPAKLFAYSDSLNTERYPFSFTLPLDCSQSDIEDCEGTPFFNSARNQPLPPSFLFEQAVLTDKCSVSYVLKAELLAPTHNGYRMHGSLSNTQDVQVYATRSGQAPTVEHMPEIKTCHAQSQDVLPRDQYDILANPNKREGGFREKLGFKSTPPDCYRKAVFTAKLLSPSIATINQPIPFELHVNHNQDLSTVQTRPLVHLRKVQVWIRTETSICAFAPRSGKTGEREQTGWKQDSETFMKSFDEVFPRVEHLDLRRVMNLNIDPRTTPTFKTFNIARTYSLRVNLVIQCLGKEFHMFGNYTRCTFLPKDYASAVREYTLPPPLPPGESDDMPDEPPPPYQSIADDRPPQVTQPALNLQQNSNTAASADVNPTVGPSVDWHGLGSEDLAAPSLTVRPRVGGRSSYEPRRRSEDTRRPSLTVRSLGVPSQQRRRSEDVHGPSLTPRPFIAAQQRLQVDEPSGPSLTVRGIHGRSRSTGNAGHATSLGFSF